MRRIAGSQSLLRIVGEIYDPDEEKDRVEKQQNRAKIQQNLGSDKPVFLSGKSGRTW